MSRPPGRHRTRRLLLGRAGRRAVVLAVIASGGLGLALGLGLPDPGVAERAYGSLLGLLGWALAVRWLWALTKGGAPGGDFGPDEGEEEASAGPPAVAEARNLERALRLGAVTIGAYEALVRPRLEALSGAKLAGAKGTAEGRTPSELLGEAWDLVDPSAPPPQDRLAPGVPLSRVELLADALERLE